MKLDDIQKLIDQAPHLHNTADPASAEKLLRSLGIESSNFYQELEMSSRYVDTHQDVSYSSPSIHLHSHTFYEILYCHNTCGAEYLVGSERYHLKKGDIIIVMPGVSHCPLLPTHMPEPYIRDVLWLSTEFVDMITSMFPEVPSDIPHNSCLIRTGGTKWQYLGELFRTGVLEAEAGNPGWEMAVIGNTFTLIAHLRRVFQDRTSRSLKAEKPDLLDQVMAYIEDNLSQRITLADTAKHFFVSESTISHIFKEKLGTSFYRCVTQRRLISAKTLILQGVHLEAVGEQVGFTDYSSFYRAFKQEYGISPRQFRKLRDNPSDGR